MVFFASSFHRRYFHFVLYRELILQGASDQRLLCFIFLPETGEQSPIFTYLPQAAIPLSCHIFSVNYQETILHRKG